ncbi:fam-m protein [Plasmodium malariae]|uniref:Fam-m protein n=1 Tax=Plasmodium malariae TaxID=5858 RepID=A0A1D3PB55_PLAMA|nr:fam-m protein [Plasmodium malariae]SCN12510.1 fam-m protein [Plasmodium malariae]
MTNIMEQKINLILFIKITAFFLLTWICHFNRYRIFNRSVNEKLDFDHKFGTINHRLLGKHKQYMSSNNIGLKDDMSNYGEWKKRNLSNNEKGSKEIKKQANRSILDKAQYYTEVLDYNNGMFDGKYFHFEKKWIKKKDYDAFLEKNRRIQNIALKKIKFRSYGCGITIIFFFFLLGIGLPILRVYESVKEALFTPFKTCWEFIYTTLGLGGVAEAQAVIPGVEHFFLATFVIITIILAVLIILIIPKILRNNEKYKKIKYISE